MKYDLDIIVPVFREEGNISKTLQEISKISEINYRILVIYDFSEIFFCKIGPHFFNEKDFSINHLPY